MDDKQQNVSIPRSVTREVQLAREFLATLSDMRLPWSARYETWADEHSLSPELRHTVKIAILKIRTFGAIERHARRRP